MADNLKIKISLIPDEAIKAATDLSKTVGKTFESINKAAESSQEVINGLSKTFSTLKDKFVSLQKQSGFLSGSLNTVAGAAKAVGGVLLGAFAGRALFNALGKNETLVKKYGETVKKNFSKVQSTVIKTQQVYQKLNSVKDIFLGIGKSVLNVRSNVRLLAGAIAAFAGAKLLIGTFSRFTEEAQRFENSLTGVKSVASNFGITAREVTDRVEELSKDGLVPVRDVATSLKNLLATGLNLDQATELFLTFKDSASFGRQAALSLGEAIAGAAQGFKNQLSILVDNAGITKNLSILQKEYARSIGTTVGKLSEQQKVYANYVGLLREGKIFQGDALKLQKNYTGATSALNFSMTQLLVELGRFITENELILSLVRSISTALDFLRETLDSNRTAIQLLINTFIRLSIIATTTVLVIQLTKALNLLAKVVNTRAKKSLLDLPLPFANKSIKSLTRNLTLSGISFKLFGTRVKTVSDFLKTGFKVVLNGITNAFKNFFTIVTKIIKSPLFLKFALIAGVLKLVYEALVFIEKQTAVFSTVWGVLLEVVESTTSVFDPIIDLFKDLFNVIKTLVKKGIGLLVVALSKVLSFGLKLLKSNPFNIFSEQQVEKIEAAKQRLDDLSRNLIDLDFNIDNLKKTTSRSIASVNQSFKKIDIQPLKDLDRELQDVGVTDLDKLERERDQRLKVIEEGLKSEGEAYKLAVKLKEKIETDFNLKKKDLDDKANDEARKREKERLDWLEDFRKETLDLEKNIKGIVSRIGQSASQAIQFAFGGGKSDIELDLDFKLDKLYERLELGINSGFKEGITIEEFEFEKGKLDEQREQLENNTQIAVGAGFLNGISQGAKGAKDVLLGLSKAFLNRLAPGLGEALGPLLNAFMEGPEATRKMVDEFVKSIPILIENLILSIPAFIEALADNVDIIIMALIDRVDDIIIALVRATPRVAAKLASAIAIQVPLAWAKAAPKMAIDLIKAIVKDMPNSIIKAIKEGFSKTGSGLFKSLGKLIFQGFIGALTGGFNILGSLFKKLFKFDGGGRGAVEKFLGFDFPFIAFSKGGMVGGSARVSGDSQLNDTIPALLSAGEIVLPRSAVQGGVAGIFGFLDKLGVSPKGYSLGGLVEGFFNTLLGGLGSLLGGGFGFVSNLFDSAGQLVEPAFNKLTELTDFTLNPQKYIDILESLAAIGAKISLKQMVKNPIGAVQEAVKSALDYFQDSFRQILKGGAPFAQGGMVPRGFNNDTFNARLSSGEYVIDRSLTSRLSDYLDGQQPQSGGTSMTVDLLSKILSTMQREKTINTSVDFNGDTLANIILELNRSNARIA